MSTEHNDDRLLDEYLSGDSDISRQYRAESNENTPELLKRKTKASVERLIDMDHRDVTKTKKRKDWYIPLSLAAVIVLAVSVIIYNPNDLNDLYEYTHKVLNRPSNGIEPLPDTNTRPGYSYQSGKRGERDPFQSLNEESKTMGSTESVTGLAAEMEKEIYNRNREPLEGFELDSLKMTGTLEEGGERWALILTPDGTVSRVKAGNYIGRNNGRIMNVLTDRIVIREIRKNSSGRYEEHIVNMGIQ